MVLFFGLQPGENIMRKYQLLDTNNTSKPTQATKAACQGPAVNPLLNTRNTAPVSQDQKHMSAEQRQQAAKKLKQQTGFAIKQQAPQEKQERKVVKSATGFEYQNVPKISQEQELIVVLDCDPEVAKQIQRKLVRALGDACKEAGIDGAYIGASPMSDSNVELRWVSMFDPAQAAAAAKTLAAMKQAVAEGGVAKRQTH